MSLQKRFIPASLFILNYLIIFGLLLVGRSAIAAMPETIAMQGEKIITASAVQIRSAPDVGSAKVGKLSLGTVVSATKRTKGQQQGHYWYYIQAGAANGWVLGRFLRDFKPTEQEKIWYELARERLGKETLPFADTVDLVAFINTVTPKVKDKTYHGALELMHLLALQKSVDGLSYENQHQQPYAAWLDKHKKLIFHDEISGQWLVSVAAYWQLADRYKSSRVGDEIAWRAASAQLGGECEGDIACNLEREDITSAEYLRRYPQGRHVADALRGMKEVFAYILTALKEEPRYFLHIRESGKTIQGLQAAVSAANPKPKEQAEVLAQLATIRKAYDRP